MDNLSGLSLRQFLCYLAICRTGTVADAARQLGITQPAASRRITQMEDAIGVKLFDRIGRRMVPTSAALRLSGTAELALSGLSMGIASAQGKETEVLRIGALPTVANGLVTRALLKFSSTSPDTIVRVETGMGVALLERLRADQLDLVVGRMASVEKLKGLSFEPLYQDRLGAFVRPDHPLTTATNIWPGLTTYPMILPPPDAVVRSTVDTFLAARGFSMVREGFECADPIVAVPILAATDAVWLISFGAGESATSDGLVTSLDLNADDTIGQIGLTTRARTRQSSAVQEISEKIRIEASSSEDRIL